MLDNFIPIVVWMKKKTKTSLFQKIPAISCHFQPFLTIFSSYNNFQLLKANSSLFQPFKAVLVILSLFQTFPATFRQLPTIFKLVLFCFVLFFSFFLFLLFLDLRICFSSSSVLTRFYLFCYV